MFELQFHVHFTSVNPGLLLNLNTLIPFRILMIVYFLISDNLSVSQTVVTPPPHPSRLKKKDKKTKKSDFGFFV